MGGLTAGAYLSKKGYKVLILEQRNYAVYPPSEKYLELKSAATAKHIKFLTDRGILCPGMTIAHVRCDVGSLQVAIQKQFSGCIFHGYDYFNSNVRYARECGLEMVNLLDPAQLNLGEGMAFDLIICNHAFTHSMDPSSDRRTLFNALKPGGALYFYNEVNHQIRFKMGDDAYQWVALNNFHKQLLSPSCLTLFLINGGFSDITLSNDGLYMRGLAYRDSWPPDPDYQREAAAAAAAAAPDIEFNFRSWINKRNSRFYSVFKLHQKIKRALHRQLRP